MKILQLIPADHWYAKYSNGDGTCSYLKVVCFGHIEWTNKEYYVWSEKDILVSEIEGFTSHEDGIQLDILISNFKGYVYSPDDNMEVDI